MNKLLLKGVAAAFCMATMFGTTAWKVRLPRI